jgi:polysaccharide biosynthesis/export protein
VYSFSRAEATGDRGREFVFQPFDAVYVANIADFGQRHIAGVEGQVRYPGTYPIEPDVTTVRDLVEMAGGFLEDASLTSASLRRRPQASNEQRLRQLRSVPPELLSSHERRILQAGSRSDDSNVVIDFRRLFIEGADAYDQVLRGGDQLVVPRRQEEVAILGAVLEPGLVQHVPGRGVRHFVELAGGHSRNADRGGTVVIRAGSGNRVDASDVRSIEPGDAIVVPYRERRDYFRALQTTSTVVTTVTGLVLTFLAFVK